MNSRAMILRMLAVVIVLSTLSGRPVPAEQEQAKHKHAEHDHGDQVQFSIQSVKSGKWSEAGTWKPARVPGKGDRVLVRRGTFVEYDARQKDVVRLIQVVGTLSFARDRSTELNVGLLTIQHTDACSEHGFACEFEGAEQGPTTPLEQWPSGSTTTNSVKNSKVHITAMAM